MTACRACGGRCERWRTARAGEPRDPATYTLERCTACGSALTVESAPEASHETGLYSARPPRLGRAVRALQRLVGEQPLPLLARGGVAPGARVLDAGAGTGRLVAALRAAGYAGEGIDPAPRPGPAPVARRGIAEHEDSGLGGAVLWHVLEHLDDPRAAMSRVAEWVEQDGAVVVGVPNLASLQSRIAGGSWFHLDLPRHRTHFTPAGLRAVMESAGFRVERVQHLVPEHNFHGMWFALLGRLGMTPGFPFHLLKRNVRARPRDLALLLVAGPPLLPVALALELGAAATGRGGTVAVLATRGLN